MSRSLPSCNRLLFTYSIVWRFYIHAYGIQKVASQKNRRSNQIMTVMVDLTNTNHKPFGTSEYNDFWLRNHLDRNKRHVRILSHYMKPYKVIYGQIKAHTTIWNALRATAVHTKVWIALQQWRGCNSHKWRQPIGLWLLLPSAVWIKVWDIPTGCSFGI